VRLDYRVKGFLDYEFWCFLLEEAGHVLPIAGLDTGGHNCRDMDKIDLLCLDYNGGGEPTVIAGGTGPLHCTSLAGAVPSRCCEGYRRQHRSTKRGKRTGNGYETGLLRIGRGRLPPAYSFPLIRGPHATRLPDAPCRRHRPRPDAC
jgi:hypothetical protein